MKIKYFIVFFGFAFLGISHGRRSVLSNLTRAIFDGYVPSVRPYCNGTAFISVNVMLAARQILEVNEVMQNLWVLTRVSLEWKDCMLKWDPHDYDGIKFITLPYERLFVPDVSFIDRIADEESYGIKDFRPTLYSDGTIKHTYATTLVVPCSLNHVKTPYDEQVCDLKYRSWIFEKNEVDVKIAAFSVDTSRLRKHILWDVTKINGSRTESYDPSINGYSADINYKITLKRKPNHFERTILEPTIIIAIVGTFSNLLPVQSGEKISLVASTMYALTLYQTLLSEVTPRSAERMPLLTYYFIVLLVNNAFSVLVQCVVVNLYFKGQQNMPYLVKKYLLKPFLACNTFVFNGQKLDEKIHRMTNEKLWHALSECIDTFTFIQCILVIAIGGYVIIAQIQN